MQHFYLRVTLNPEVKIIISVSKKVSKKAVIRNTIKRRVRAVMRNLVKTLKPGRYLIVAQIGAENVKGQELESELIRIIRSTPTLQSGSRQNRRL